MKTTSNKEDVVLVKDENSFMRIEHFSIENQYVLVALPYGIK